MRVGDLLHKDGGFWDGYWIVEMKGDELVGRRLLPPGDTYEEQEVPKYNALDELADLEVIGNVHENPELLEKEQV